MNPLTTSDSIDRVVASDSVDGTRITCQVGADTDTYWMIVMRRTGAEERRVVREISRELRGLLLTVALRRYPELRPSALDDADDDD